jgi:membrane-associated PAP2 superfamily phosphatase
MKRLLPAGIAIGVAIGVSTLTRIALLSRGAAEWFAIFASPPANPGPGRCLPAGHPSAGFALFALYFALRESRPQAARVGLAAAWIVGTVAAAVQVARGAHFVSHALWTAWIAWAVNLALYLALRRAAARS